MDVTFAKVDDDQRIVYGWASVIKRDGALVDDHQGDVIEMEELEKAAHRYVQTARVGKAMHTGEQTADLIERFVVSPVGRTRADRSHPPHHAGARRRRGLGRPVAAELQRGGSVAARRASGDRRGTD